MPARIARACRATGKPVPDTPAEFVRCILDSLALAHRHALRIAQELTGRQVETVHPVGGGARNALRCQLTADACGVRVVAGPVEAAAFGNVLIQARASARSPVISRRCARCCGPSGCATTRRAATSGLGAPPNGESGRTERRLAVRLALWQLPRSVE